MIKWILSLIRSWKLQRTVKLDILQDETDKRDIDLSLGYDEIPTKVDFSEYCPPIKNQGRIGSCGSHTAISGIETLLKLKNPKWLKPLSERFHYYMVRQKEYENTFPNDSGQHGRNAMKVLKNVGCALESISPYIEYKFNTMHDLEFIKSISRFWKITQYERCFSVIGIKHALANNKLVWLGVPVKKSIFKNQGKKMEYNKEEIDAGGHAMLVVGYDDTNSTLKLLNSWGESWGHTGFGYMDYQYIKDAPWFDAWAFNIKVQNE